MKMLLLAVFAFCISQAVGFGLYGCFERVMYWQAYQMDADSDEKKVGKTCATDPSVHEAKLGKLVQGRCNLRQFLYHISSNEDEKAAIKKLNEKDLAAAEQKSPGVVELAKVLYKGRIGSSYDNAHVYEGVDRGAGHIPKLYTAIGKLIGANDNPKNNKLVRNALTARNQIQEGRIAGRVREVGDALRERYDKEHNIKPAKGKMITEGLVRESRLNGLWETVDLYQARKAIEKAHSIPKLKMAAFIKEMDKENSNAIDKSHQENIVAIREAKSHMKNGMCSKG